MGVMAVIAVVMVVMVMLLDLDRRGTAGLRNLAVNMLELDRRMIDAEALAQRVADLRQDALALGGRDVGDGYVAG